jgi:hypothetical protein
MIALFLSASIRTSNACEPMQETPNIKTSIKRSDIIIIGKKAKWQRTIDYKNFDKDPPRKIEVLEVLKGSLDDNKIKVKGAWGMCGIAFNFIDDAHHILFLTSPHNGLYYPAGDYNEITSLKIDEEEKLNINEKGELILNGDTLLSLEKFKKSFLMQATDK